MPLCISKHRFIRVRISILLSKIIFGHLEAAGGCQRPARYSAYVRFNTSMPLYISKHRFIRVRISILLSKIIFGHLEAAGGCQRPARYSAYIGV